MNNFRQNGLNAAAGSMLLLGALIRLISMIDTFKAVHQMRKLGVSLSWEIWLTVILGAALVICFGAAGFFMLKGNIDLYAKAIFGVGSAILATYLIVVIYLFKTFRYIGTSYLLRWQFILIYGSMACYGLGFVLSGKYAMSVSEGTDGTKANQWMQAPGAFVTSIVLIIIAALGLNSSPFDMLSTVDTADWIQILSFILDFLILLVAGMHLRRIEQETYHAPGSDSPRYNVPTAAGPGYGGDMYNNPNSQAYGGQMYGGMNNNPNAQAFGAGAAFAAQQFNNQNRPIYGQTPAAEYSKGIDMPQKPDLSKGIDMPQKPEASQEESIEPGAFSTLDTPPGINVPSDFDIPMGDFDELLNYGRNKGYGQDDAPEEPDKEV